MAIYNQESIEIVPLYFAAPRPTVKRDGQILMVDDKRFRLGLNEKPQIRSVRFRTLGCLTGAVLSKATKLTDIIEEMLLTITSERQGRVIDMNSWKRKKNYLMTYEVFKNDFIHNDVNSYLHRQQNKSLLRFITCGSVDDGKSTLIGLLYDSKMIFEDQLAQLKKDSKKVGTQGKEIDFALIVDGLEAEREQGITIDVAYRFFSTEKRKFIVADTPGHEEYS